MGIFDSFSKQPPSPPEPQAEPTPAGVALQIVFEAPVHLSAEGMQFAVRAYDAALRAATIEFANAGNSGLGTVQWGAHQVQVVVFDLPMPPEVLDWTVTPAAYDAPTKARARAGQGHGLLYYRGRARNVSEQYVALALVAGALCGESAVAVLNEAACTSLPASAFTGEIGGMSRSEFFRTLPPLYLFAGFVKYNLENAPGVWMRTYGLHAWGLPNLATLVESHARGSEIFDVFNNVASYMMSAGPVLDAGHTMQVGEAVFMRLRQPGAAEAPLMLDDHPLLIADFIRDDEANAHVFGDQH